MGSTSNLVNNAAQQAYISLRGNTFGPDMFVVGPSSVHLYSNGGGSTGASMQIGSDGKIYLVVGANRSIRTNTVGRMFTSYANGTLTNDTNEASVLGTVAGANAFYDRDLCEEGRTMVIRIAGVISTAGSPGTLKLSVYLGTTAALTTGNINPLGAMTSVPFWAEFVLTGRGSNNIFPQSMGGLCYNNGTNVVSHPMKSINTVSPSSAFFSADVKAQWGSASPSNVLVTTNVTCEILG